MNFTLKGDDIGKYRRKLLSGVQGKVLEIGFGTGLNLPHYPRKVKDLTVIEPNAGMNSLAQRQIGQSSIKVKHYALKGEKLPFKSTTFNSVVSTFTLCSIEQIQKALKEIRRVLKPRGKFFFLEHGLSPQSNIQKWQNRLNPFQNFIGDGCHLNRDMQKIIEDTSFKMISLKKFYMEKLPKIVGYCYLGIARKS